MKRYLFVYLLLLCHVTVSKAQSNTDAWFMHVYLRNGRCDNYALKEIDSVTFSKNIEGTIFNTNWPIIQEERTPNLVIRQGYVSQRADTFRIMRNDECIAIIKMSEPMIIAQAEKEESWGYFQFPIIYRAENNNLIVYWSMKVDAHTGYGEESYGWRMSKDEGATWEKLDRDYFRKERTRVEFRNGDVLQVKDPTTKNIDSYDSFPKPVNEEAIAGYMFYKENELPDELQGIYLASWRKQNNESTIIHSNIEDYGLLRHAINGKMPIVWWGNIKELGDGSLIAGVYPGYYQNVDGTITNSGISFYSSKDNGLHWVINGVIPYYNKNSEGVNIFDGSEGFTEPSFEILEDGSMVCVMRSGGYNPMYRAFSSDNGSHWSIPEPFTPNGVMPNMMLLGNGVLALASGRPGLQLRFNIDGDGLTWTEPIEMIPFINEYGTYFTSLTKRESCGYPSVIEADDHTFYLTYSDFKTKNEKGEYRKSILFRKIEVLRR